MFTKISRKLITNRKQNTLFFAIIFLLITSISIGYSALNQELMITGDIEYFSDSNTLYNVLKRAAKNGTYATEYTGSHQDSWAGDGIEDIYYWYATNDANGTAILDMNNVIFAGQCWQMIRTTDTGGVKLLYNGEAENNQCLNTRGTHIGYGNRASQTLNSSYYYGTDYTYDATNNVFTLAGSLEQKTWDATTGPTLIGKYTCKNASATGTCATIYLIESYNTATSAYAFPISKNSHYSQFGTLAYNNSYNSPAYVGYMYNDVYPVTSKSNIFYTQNSSWTVNTSYYYSDTIDWNTTTSNQYTLLNSPQQLSTLSGDYSSLVGKYVLNGAGTNAAEARYVVGVNGTTLYFKTLSNGDLNTSLTIGDSYTESGGVYTLTGNVTNVPYQTWYNSTSLGDYKGKYVCDGANTSCTNIKHIRADSNPSKNYYYYFDTTTTWSFAESVSYNGSSYTLTGDIKTFWDFFDETNKSYLPTHHYTCLGNGTSCTTVEYVNYFDSTSIYYAQLNGVENIETAINNMLYASNVNTKNSPIKSAVDAWFAKYLSGYNSYLEDTIFCNDRTIKSLGGWNPDGGGITSSSNYLQFQESTATKDLSCDRVTDQFSTLNNGAQLTYKVGLMSNPEMNLLNNSKIRATGAWFWLASPYYFNYYGAIVRSVNTGGSLSNVNTNSVYGLRPAVSILPGTVYTSGDGSMANPYIVDSKPDAHQKPVTPTIAGATTKIYGSSAATLTCSTITDYIEGTTKYYSFGYATSDGGSPSNWTTASTNSTLSVDTNYIGNRYYSCRVYASDGTTTSETDTSLPAEDALVAVNHASITFNAGVGTLNGVGTLYAKNGDANIYTTIQGTTVGTIPTASQTDYTFTGWYTAATNGSKVLNADGTFTGTAVSGYTTANAWATIADKTLYAQYRIGPQAPTISGGTTKIYNYSDTTLTCETPSTYAEGISIYYEFGYATSINNFNIGTISWLGNPSTTNTYSVAKESYRGTRYYTCRIYATDGIESSDPIMTTATTMMSLVNARLYFDTTENGGALSGSANLYVPYGETDIYTGRDNETTGTIPSATKEGYIFNGWYSAASGGTQVINDSGVVQANVSNWTNSSKQWIRTETSDDNTSNVLYAQYAPISYSIGYTMNGGTSGSNAPTSASYDETVTINKPTKTFTVNIDPNSQGATITSGGNVVTSVSGAQTFDGWTSSNINTSTAKYGSSSSSVTTSWSNGATKVGASNTTTYFKNLVGSPETVTLTANWTAGSITLPKLEKAGYTCTYNAAADGSGTTYASEGTYTSDVTTGSDTLYVRCIDDVVPVVSTATSSTTLDLTNYVNFTATDAGSKIVGYNITTSTTAPTTWIPVVSTVDSGIETKYADSAAWARVFHHNNHWGATYFTNATDAQSSNTNDKYSILGNLENYKFSNKWEFLLEYPDKSATEYNRWTQTGNPATTTVANGDGTENAPGYAASHIDWTGNYWGGLTLSTSGNTFINGSVGHSNWFYAIGAYSAYQNGMPGPNNTRVSTANLWARIDGLTTTNSANLTRRIGGITSNGTYYVWVKDSAGNTGYKTVTVSNVDTTAPTASITSTNNVATSQTATIALGDNKAIDKYYFGTTNPASTNVTYTSVSGTVTSETLTETISEEGTYYVAVIDKAGNRTIANKVFYKTTLTPNRGTVSPTTVITMAGNSFTIPTPSAVTGYTWGGWYKESALTNSAGTSYTPVDSITLYGKWTANTNTVSFNVNGGGGSGYQTANVTATYGSAMPTISTTKPTKTGYTFGGWYDTSAATGGTQYYTAAGASARTWNKTSNTTLYARWTANTYTINYAMNGGNSGSNAPTSATYDDNVTVSKPTKTFTVNIDANSQGATITSGGNAVTSASSTQTFAGWTATNLDTSTAKYGTSSSAVTTSWNGTTKVGASNATIYFKNLRSTTGATTLTANWTAVALTLPTLTKTGYTCGYATSASGNVVYSSGASYTPSTTAGSANLYVRCTVNTYTITLNMQSGSGGTSTIYEVYGTNYRLTSSGSNMSTSSNPITIPTRPCYTFGGYYTSTNGGGTQYIDANGYITSSASTTHFTANGTLYAKWTAKDTVYVSSSGNDTYSGTSDKSFKTIAQAYTCPGVSSGLSIKLLSNITQTSQLSFNTASKKVNLSSNGDGTTKYKITRGSALTDNYLLAVSNSGTLTITNLILDGNNVASTKALILATTSSTLNLNSGTTVQRAKNSGDGGGVFVNSSSTLNINGATITNNTLTGDTSAGAGVCATASTVVMNSGTISNNTTSHNGGGIFGGSDATITIKGGNITGNSANSGIGGGIYSYCGSADSNLSIAGVTISSNSAETGAGVAIYSGSTGECSALLTMTSGTITQNTASGRGGGIFASVADADTTSTERTLTAAISGGTISSNTSGSEGGGVYSYYYDVTISGSSTKIQNNTAATHGGGIRLAKAGSLTLKAGTISGNKATSGKGGGVCIGPTSTFAFQGGTITTNECGGSSTTCGGGVFKNSTGTYSKTGGTLSSNTPDNYMAG